MQGTVHGYLIHWVSAIITLTSSYETIFSLFISIIKILLFAFSVEISVRILSMLELKMETLMSLLPVDRLFYTFMKSHET